MDTKIPKLKTGVVFPDPKLDQIQFCLNSNCKHDNIGCTECLFDQENLPEFMERNKDGAR